MVGVSSAAPATPWALTTQSTSETQANGVFDGQVAVMGYNSDGTIRAAYTGNSTSSTQGFIKPILFDPSTSAITFGTKVNCMTFTSAVIYGLKTVSETEYSIGTADATNFGITYLPNNNSPGTSVSVYPFSMNSAGAVTVGTSVALNLSNVGTADMATDIAFDGLYSSVPRYTLFSRYDVGTANQYAISRSSNTLSITRSHNSAFSIGNKTTVSGSFAELNDASSLGHNGNGGNLQATTFGSTTRTSTDTASGLSGFANIVLIESGTVSKYLMYAANGAGTDSSSKIVTVTYSASVAPTISLGAITQENASVRTQQNVVRLVKHYDAGKAYMFFIESNELKVKTITVSGTSHSYSAATTIGALTATSFDIQTAYVNAESRHFIGVAYNSGNTTAFVVSNPNT